MAVVFGSTRGGIALVQPTVAVVMTMTPGRALARSVGMAPVMSGSVAIAASVSVAVSVSVSVPISVSLAAVVSESVSTRTACVLVAACQVTGVVATKGRECPTYISIAATRATPVTVIAGVGIVCSAGW